MLVTTDQGSGNDADQGGETQTGQAAAPGPENEGPAEAAVVNPAATSPSSAATPPPAVTSPPQPAPAPAATPSAPPAADLSGWYQASDGQWYQHPGYAAGSDQPQPTQPQTAQTAQTQPAQPQPAPQAQYPQAAYASPQYQQPQYPQAAYGQPQYPGQYAQGQYPQGQYGQAQYSQGHVPPGQYPPGQYPPAGYGAPAYAYVTPIGPKHNGMAIASLICAIGGIFFLGIPSVLGIIFGFIARNQIERSDGNQTGSGLALAGIIVGFCVVGIGILIFILAIIGAHSGCNGSNNFGNC